MRRLVFGALLGLMALGFAVPARAQSRLAEFLQKVPAAEIFPGADRFGPVEGTPPAVTAFKAGEPAGYVFLNSDFADATGYSGKQIEILAASVSREIDLAFARLHKIGLTHSWSVLTRCS